jgi:transposase
MISEQELIANLQNLLQEKDTHIQSLQTKVQTLQQQLHVAMHARFGRKSEKGTTVDEQQLSLCFDEAEVGPLEIEPLRATDESIHIPAHARKKTGRKPLPKELPRVQHIHDLPANEKVCNC